MRTCSSSRLYDMPDVALSSNFSNTASILIPRSGQGISARPDSTTDLSQAEEYCFGGGMLESC